jgi:hypothetical protein
MPGCQPTHGWFHWTRNHIQNILMKLDAHSKLEAVAIALRKGLVAADDVRRDSTRPSR